MEYLEGMLQKEKDNFSRVCNRLLGTCFLCKGNLNTMGYHLNKFHTKQIIILC